MAPTYLTRRTLLKTAAGTIAAPYVIASAALGDDKKAPASERVTLGHIGVGSRGRQLLRGFLRCKNAQSVAFADPWKDRREAAAKQCGGKAYGDFRELLARDDIDAVVVATPDHWHVPIANMAARAKKDAYVEKPLGVSIEQDLACRKVFQDNDRIFQYGTQQRSMQPCRLACELVRGGRIGKIRRIEVTAPDGAAGGSTKEVPVPELLDYDMFNGPAEPKPYSRGRCRRKATYWIYDYSIGYLGGWGAHPLDLMVWACDADRGGMVEIEGTGVIPGKGLYDTVIHWDMKGKLGDVEFAFRAVRRRDSTKFIGDEGWIDVGRGHLDAEPKSLLKTKIDPTESQLLVSRSQDQNFVDAVKSRGPTVSPIEDAVRSDVISLLCDIAVRTGRRITWDPTKETIVDDAEAAAMMHRPMRKPWTL